MSRYISWLKSKDGTYSYENKKKSLQEEYEELRKEKNFSTMNKKEKALFTLYGMVCEIEATEKKVDEMLKNKSYLSLNELEENRREINIQDKVATILECFSIILRELPHIYSMLSLDSVERMEKCMEEIQNIMDTRKPQVSG